VQSKILLRQHLLLKIIMKSKVVKAERFYFCFSCLPRTDFPISYLPSSRCHLSSKLALLINKETVSSQPALCIITQEPADLQRPTIKKSKSPFSFYKTFYPHLQWKHIKRV
jgi:hypothetical protein